MVATGTENLGSIPEKEPEKRLLHPRKATGAQITQSQFGEVVKRNNNRGSIHFCGLDSVQIKQFNQWNWRESLVPAAAVIPAPIANVKVAAIKTPVVELEGSGAARPQGWRSSAGPFRREAAAPSMGPCAPAVSFE